MANRTSSIDALVLRVKDVPSGARVVTLLSAEDGVVEAFAFGGGKSKLRSLAAPWHFGRAWLYRDVAKGLVKLSDFDPSTEFSAVRSSLSSISAASFAAEFLAVTGALGGDWPFSLELALGLLTALDEGARRAPDDGQIARAASLFALRAVEAMGLCPVPGECPACAGASGSDALHSYSRRHGGFVCHRCAEPGDLAVPPGALAWLAASRARSLAEASRVGLAAESAAVLKAAALDMARRAAGSPLRTLEAGLL